MIVLKLNDISMFPNKELKEHGVFVPSRFNIDEPVNNGFLLYNTATEALVYYNKKEDLMESFEKLKLLNFYVPENFDEVGWVDQYRKTASQNKPIACIKKYTILTTTDCNARCFYCYEKGIPHFTMTQSVANDTAEYIINELKGKGEKSIMLRWFGGEPLMNVEAINTICTKLCNNGVSFCSKMISNGLLFDNKTVSIAKDVWNLKKVQITLDGTKSVYQRIKAYRNHTGNEFDTVIGNIMLLLDFGISVNIRLNQNENNTSDLLELVNTIHNMIGRHKFLRVYNSLLYEDDYNQEDTKEIMRYESYQKLQDLLIEKRYLPKAKLPKIKRKHCMADCDNSVVISPNGDIGKCEHYPFDYTIGTIYKEASNKSEVLGRWKEIYSPQSRCYSCSLYPLCYRITMCPEEHLSCTLVQREDKMKKIKMAIRQLYFRKREVGR